VHSACACVCVCMCVSEREGLRLIHGAVARIIDTCACACSIYNAEIKRVVFEIIREDVCVRVCVCNAYI